MNRNGSCGDPTKEGPKDGNLPVRVVDQGPGQQLNEAGPGWAILIHVRRTTCFRVMCIFLVLFLLLVFPEMFFRCSRVIEACPVTTD